MGLNPNAYFKYPVELEILFLFWKFSLESVILLVINDFVKWRKSGFSSEQTLNQRVKQSETFRLLPDIAVSILAGNNIKKGLFQTRIVFGAGDNFIQEF